MNRFFDIDANTELEDFAADLHVAFPEASTAHLESTHVAAMMQAVRLMADKGEPVGRPASKADGPENQVSGLPKPGRMSQMYEKLFATRAAKLATITVALLFALSGLAVAGGLGALPDPMQDAVANGVAPLGVNLPGGDDDAEDEAAEAAEEAEDEAAEAAEEAEEAAEDAAEDADNLDEDARDNDDDDSDDDSDADDDADDDADADDDSDDDADGDDSDDDADADDDSDEDDGDSGDDSDDDADADDDSDEDDGDSDDDSDDDDDDSDDDDDEDED